MSKIKDRDKKKEKTHKQIKEEKEVLSIKVQEYKELKEKAKLADERLEMLMRIQAEFENSKKRMEKEKAEFIKFANNELISRLLPILDNFRLAVKTIDSNHNIKDIIAGIELIEKHFEDTLKEFGLEEIKAVGERFNPHYHKAIAHEETDEYEDEIVMEEFQKGYLLNGRLLRPAVVKVAKKPKTENGCKS